MIDRLLILTTVILAVAAVWGGLRLWQRYKLRRMAGERPFQQVVPSGRPAIVAFTDPHCYDCYGRQTPALTRLQKTVHDRVTITSLSALEHPDLVDRLGILTVPATVVIDAQGSIRHLNLGYASDVKLREQLAALQA